MSLRVKIIELAFELCLKVFYEHFSSILGLYHRVTAVHTTKFEMSSYRDMRKRLDKKVVNRIEKKTYCHKCICLLSIWEYILQRDDNGYVVYRDGRNFNPSALYRGNSQWQNRIDLQLQQIYGHKNTTIHFSTQQKFFFSPKYHMH